MWSFTGKSIPEIKFPLFFFCGWKSSKSKSHESCVFVITSKGTRFKVQNESSITPTTGIHHCKYRYMLYISHPSQESISWCHGRIGNPKDPWIIPKTSHELVGELNSHGGWKKTHLPCPFFKEKEVIMLAYSFSRTNKTHVVFFRAFLLGDSDFIVRGHQMQRTISWSFHNFN